MFPGDEDEANTGTDEATDEPSETPADETPEDAAEERSEGASDAPSEESDEAPSGEETDEAAPEGDGGEEAQADGEESQDGSSEDATAAFETSFDTGDVDISDIVNEAGGDASQGDSGSDDGEQLSAAELEALAGAFSTPEDEQRSSSEVRADQEPVVLRYDLVGSSGGQRHDFPALDLIHQSFTLSLGTKLERETRREGAFVSNQPEMMNFSEIYATLPMPTGVLVVEVAGLGCTGLILVEPGLLVHLIELLMGGQGRGTQSPELFANRTFTGTERLIINRLVKFIDISLRVAWGEICPVNIRLVRAEVDPRHAAVFNPADRVCEFRMDMEWDEVVGDVRILLPMEALRPFEKRLALTTVSPKSATDSGWRDLMHDVLLDVPVSLTANLGCAEMSVRQILDLKEGDYLRLDRDPETLLDLFVEGQLLYTVEPTVQQGNVAVVLLDDEPQDISSEDDRANTPVEPAAAQENPS